MMSAVDLDVAPVREQRPFRYVARTQLLDRTGTVDEVATVIDAAHLVSSSLGLAQGIDRLAEFGFYFVLGRDKLSGIVTLADLQLPPVSMVTFALTLRLRQESNA